MKVLNSYETIQIYMFPESCAAIVKELILTKSQKTRCNISYSNFTFLC